MAPKSELNEWRRLMPYALASGHLPRPPQAEFASIFNGDSIGFLSPQTAEGSVAFGTFWNAYQNWWSVGRQPPWWSERRRSRSVTDTTTIH